MSVINLSDGEAADKFQKINPKNVLYFTAQWCGPCRTIGPIVEDLSKTYESVAFGKVDVDVNSEAAMKYQISAVPTFIFFDGETETSKFSGADPAQLETQVKSLMDK
eukprot:CAMPEP_0194211400 /NCGR_PEP_ID=MMETSP0156-20130528/10218_1 /TAXON_ID=33649 /ORGANISM="Thalassionema nitzschioides, Strain L26-B" /LENGTH=106 /DNA_ID=CAMNT_0038938933 /DNA_START=128 /DNA_END=448 /DNA_ORIENTATION=+